MWPKHEMLLSLRPKTHVRNQSTTSSLVVLFPSSKECAGFWGLWHFFTRCLNVAVDMSRILDPARRRDQYWNRKNTNVLVFYAGGGGHSVGCELPPMVEAWRPLLQALFRGGIYKNPDCVEGDLDIDRFAIARKPPQIVLASDDLKLLYREAAARAFGVAEPAHASDTLRIVHMVREDEGPRALESDQPIVEAFARQASNIEWIRCCNFSAPNSTEVALRAVASADVLLGMHGAGLTHSYWMRERGVVVDLLADIPDQFRTMWYYKKHGYQTSYVSFALSNPQKKQNHDRSRAIINRTIADAVATCVLAIVCNNQDRRLNYPRLRPPQMCNPQTSPGLVSQYLAAPPSPGAAM